MKSVTFEIIGDKTLVCEGCEERVENALKTLQGVRKVRAQSRNQQIHVLFDSTILADDNTIAERIDKAGYQTRIIGSTSK